MPHPDATMYRSYIIKLGNLILPHIQLCLQSFYVYSMFPGPVHATAHLVTIASQRLWITFRPATLHAYTCMVKCFLTFCSS